MGKKVSVGTALLIGAICALAAIFVYRSLIGGGPDRIDENIEALRAQLARSQQQRDSLQLAINIRQDSLNLLIAREASFEQSISEMRTEINQKDNELRRRRRSLTRTNLQPDELLRDLNTIVRTIRADTSAVGGDSG